MNIGGKEGGVVEAKTGESYADGKTRKRRKRKGMSSLFMYTLQGSVSQEYGSVVCPVQY